MSREREVTSGAFSELEFATLYEAFNAIDQKELWIIEDGGHKYVNDVASIAALSEKMERIMDKIRKQIPETITTPAD